MASERERAKGSVTSREESDPELDEVLSAAERLQLETKKAEYSHKETMRAKDLGSIGALFGGEKSAPTYIALLAMLLGVFGAGICWYQAAGELEISARKFWANQAERAIAFSAAALAFIFGRGAK